MTDIHDPRHAALLEEALTCASAQRASPRFDELRACPRCAAQLDELDQLERDLARAAAIEREVLAEAATGLERADPDRVRRALARHEAELARDEAGLARDEAGLARRDAGPGRDDIGLARRTAARARRKLGWIAAAAVLAFVLGAFAWRLARPSAPAVGPPPAIQLGPGDELRVHAPVRNSDGSATFAWDAPSHPGLAIRLIARSTDPATRPFDETLEADRCVVPASTVAAWSAAGDVLWRVEVYDASGALLGSSDEQRWSPR